ncbi:MAG: YitT family protein [Intestinibacillus sp.]
MKRISTARIALDGVFLVLGSLLIAVAINMFTAPNNIAPGGATGAATLLQALFGVPIGMTNLAINIPLFLWGIRATGARSMGKSAVAVVLSSFAIDLTAGILPPYRGDGMLAAVFGGVLVGAGLALIFSRGGTTGGTDLAAYLLGRHLRHVSIGKLILLIDLPIVLCSILVYGSIESPMYAMIVIFLTSKVVDAILYGTGAGTGKLVFIFSQQNHKIKQDILFGLSRGVTELRARGSYSGRENEVLLVAVRRPEVSRIYDLVRAADPDAFIIVTEANEITGEGFLSPEQK